MANLRRAEAELLQGGSSMAFLRKARHTFGKHNKKYFEILEAAIEYDAELGGDIMIDEEEEQPPAHVPAAGPQVDPADNDMLCCICIDRRKDAVIIPCGHHRVCERCGNDLIEEARGSGREPTCPYCRQPVWMIRKLI